MVSRQGFGGAAGGADAPEGDLGLVDHEPGALGRVEARRVPDGAIDVAGLPTGAADQVVVVVGHPGLVPGGMARRLDPPEEAGVGQGVEDVVDGLGGDASEAPRDGGADRVGVGVVGHPVEDVQDGDPWSRHPQSLDAKPLGDVVQMIRHRDQPTITLESFKKDYHIE